MNEGNNSCDVLISLFLTSKCLEDRLQAARKLYNMASKNNSIKSHILKSDRSLLHDLWEYLRPDGIQRRQGVDQSNVLLELHLISLKILRIVNCRGSALVSTCIITIDNLHVIYDLLMLHFNNKHNSCCSQALDSSWDVKTIEKARNLMLGQVYEALYDELNGQIYDVELLTTETGESVVDVLHQECNVEVNNLTVNLKSANTSSEMVKVVHVLSPQYVWVQELTDDIDDINQDMAEHLATARLATINDNQVVVRLKKLNFRGQVLKWNETTAVVLAIDYGWQSEVLHNIIYQTEEHISELPPLAKLCRIINVGPLAPCKNTEIQVHAIKLLQTLTNSEPFVVAILNNHMGPVLKFLETTRYARLTCEILLFFSQLCYCHRHRDMCGELMIKPVLRCLKKWFFCTDVLAQGLECARNMVSSSRKNRQLFIFEGGLEVFFNAYATYDKDETVHSHALHILKFCLEYYEFDSNAYQVHSIESISMLDNLSESTILFSHLGSMSQFNIKQCDTVSFLENIIKQQELVVFAREVVSYLNSQDGGTVYIGVTYQGLINGLQMNRSRRDDYRTKIDMVLSKMVCDYKLTELPNQLFECSFDNVKNTHKRAMPEDTSMYVIKVSIKPGRVLSRLRDADTNVFYKRRHGCVFPLSANEIRQHVADLVTSDRSSPFTEDMPASPKDETFFQQDESEAPQNPVDEQPGQSQTFAVPDLFSPSGTSDLSPSKQNAGLLVGPPPLVPISQLRRI